jgi:hypothetical protein
VRPIRSAARWPASRWVAFSGVIAATLLIGVLIGRTTAPKGGPAMAPLVEQPLAGASVAPVVPSTDPYQRVSDELLGRSAVLLAALPESGGRGEADGRLAEQGAQLLTTTRLLLDSPVGTDPRMRPLLEDLELVLVQVARIRGPHQQDDMSLIHDALDQRDIVPRIRSAVARNAQRIN